MSNIPPFIDSDKYEAITDTTEKNKFLETHM